MQSPAPIRGSINDLSIPELAYIAGILDGEGCISIIRQVNRHRNSSVWFYLRIRIASNHRGMLEWLQARLGRGTNILRMTAPRPGHRQGWQLDLTHWRAADLLVKLNPFMIIKKSQAELALTFARQRASRPSARTKRPFGPTPTPSPAEREEDERFWIRMKSLKRET
jgi:hypothetical protein